MRPVTQHMGQREAAEALGMTRNALEKVERRALAKIRKNQELMARLYDYYLAIEDRAEVAEFNISTKREEGQWAK